MGSSPCGGLHENPRLSSRPSPSFHERGGGDQVKYAGDRCSVCDADVDYDCDQLISCDKCGITVHQTCYGVHEKVSNDEIWLCNVCRAQGTENAECCLCPIAEGARKPTTIPGLWCHVACMQWIPEVTLPPLASLLNASLLCLGDGYESYENGTRVQN